MERTSHKSFNQCDPCLISGQPRDESSQAELCSGTSCNSNSITHVSRDDSEMEFGIGKRQLTCTNFGFTKDSSDPFAFHEDDFEPSKWEFLSGSTNKFLSLDGRASVSGYKDGSNSVPVSQQESNNVEYHHFQETSCSSAVDEDKSNLLADCLLTAVKVLAYL